MATKKPNVKDWRNLPKESWTVTTFRQFLYDQHEAKYGIKYTTRSFAIEGRWIKAMVAEHGAEVVKAFIEGCLAEYKPTRDYPGLNFSFMFTYQRARVLPRVLAEVKRKEQAEARRNHTPQESIEDITEWL
ncbi:hypothetical protein COJ96_05660 [Bacillus sp. AFS073361]|uniref:hypothetical protein n=1 Tax=Bacillus sp. AFS073361 TaxID=2033511 RepID=UPI000BF74867|nr:hypothetical protein [Bacillus sp. AFS073361]PFP30200.1 hypothetical protein COJ96_05660 [Bacillus sp. AFS073361]